MSDPSLNPEDKLYAVYNQKRINAGKEPIVPSEFNMGPTEVYSGPRSNHNSRTRLVPKASTASFGRLNLYHDRESLETAITTPLKVVKGNATTIHQLINEINEELGIESTTADWLDGPLGATNFTLIASPLNRIFLGSTLVTYY
jgi:hypothetical protein